MSVLIKGMEMPENCFDCPCCNNENGYCKIRNEYVYGEVPRSCPLVPVPPHGKLKDADALKNIVLEALNDAITDGNSTPLGRALCTFIAKNTVEEIDALPTIISADATDTNVGHKSADKGGE